MNPIHPLLPAGLDALFEPHNRGDAPGLVVGVAQAGHPVYRRGFGLASIEHGATNTPFTRMRIGSVTKHMTCLAALLLAEEGKLDIDAGVRRYLPALPEAQGDATLRQLMNHTSGYRCYLDLASLGEGPAIKPRGEVLAAQLRQGTANFAPGEKMVYCNGGYQLLSLVIEAVSGMSFERFLQERIFAPLGMHDTASVPSDFDIHPHMATLHIPRPPGEGPGWRRGLFPTEEIRGEGAVVSTIDDMLAWLAHLRASRKTVGNEASWRQMLTRTTLDNGIVNPYGLGLFRHDYRGVEVLHHAGGVVGGTCQMLTVPAHALDIIIMTNGAPVNPIELGYRIVDIALADVLSAPVEKTAAARFAPMLGTRYRAPASGLVFGFAEADGGRLGLSFLDGEPVALSEDGDILYVGFEEMAMGPFAVRSAALAQGDDSAPAALAFSEAGHVELCERLPATPPDPAEAGRELTGRYRAPDLDAHARMRCDEGRLVLEVSGRHGVDVMELTAFSDDVFGIRFGGEYPPMHGVLDVERPGGRVMALRVNTPRTRNLRFERVMTEE